MTQAEPAAHDETRPQPNERPPIERVKDHDVGVHVGKDTYMGKFRIRLDPDMSPEDFREALTDSIKPIFYARHRLVAEDGREGPEVNFHWNRDAKDWEIQYRFVRRDEHGEPTADAGGRKQYDYYTQQVAQIARQAAQDIADRLAKKLGRRPEEERAV